MAHFVLEIDPDDDLSDDDKKSFIKDLGGPENISLFKTNGTDHAVEMAEIQPPFGVTNKSPDYTAP